MDYTFHDVQKIRASIDRHEDSINVIDHKLFLLRFERHQTPITVRFGHQGDVGTVELSRRNSAHMQSLRPEYSDFVRCLITGLRAQRGELVRKKQDAKLELAKALRFIADKL